MAVVRLADCPQWVGTLAAWHHAQWGELYADAWTLDDACAELAAHAASGGEFPTTLVWREGDAVLGSVSLVAEDAPALSDRGGPWLASLYVVPAARGCGLGAALVRAAVAEAVRIGLPRLCLFTPEHADFYARLGWRAYGHAELRGTPVTLMTIETAHEAAA